MTDAQYNALLCANLDLWQAAEVLSKIITHAASPDQPLTLLPGVSTNLGEARNIVWAVQRGVEATLLQNRRNHP